MKIKNNKYFCSFEIEPSRKKVTLSYNNFDKLLADKIKQLEFYYGKIEKMKIKKVKD